MKKLFLKLTYPIRYLITLIIVLLVLIISGTLVAMLLLKEKLFTNEHNKRKL
jgi:hypothetical protein